MSQIQIYTRLSELYIILKILNLPEYVQFHYLFRKHLLSFYNENKPSFEETFISVFIFLKAGLSFILKSLIYSQQHSVTFRDIYRVPLSDLGGGVREGVIWRLH